ncbi:MAG: NfeD family protein [Solirubrobacteraceae bacterium]
MTALGFVLLVIGALLVVAEAHAPAGVFGVAGGLAVIAGGIVVIAALGGGAGLAVPVGVGLGTATGVWGLVATREARSVRRMRLRSGTEALCGRIGVLRNWTEPAGQVFVDGALWRARHEWAQAGAERLHEGDPVVVERVSGLTLSVRRAEDWELIA